MGSASPSSTDSAGPAETDSAPQVGPAGLTDDSDHEFAYPAGQPRAATVTPACRSGWRP